MKKVLAMLLALTMVVGMSLTSFAANNGDDGICGTKDDTGIIELKGITHENGLNVTAYKIIEARYDGNDNFSGYQLLYPGSGIDMDVVDAWQNVLITEDHLNSIIAAKKVESDEDYTRQYTLKRDGDYYKAEVQVGSYLVMIENAEEAIYSPVVVSVNYLNKDGKNVIFDGAVGVEEIYGVVDGDAWVKKAEHPTFTKTEADANGDTYNDGLYGNSVNAGSDVNYTLTITPIPYYGGTHPVFNVVDTLGDGLTYKAGSLKVTVNGEPFTDYKLDVEDQVITVDFAADVTEDNPVYTLNDKQGKTVVITYTATLNDSANLNSVANVNNAVLNYTKDSKVVGEEVSIEEKTYTYTFDVKSNLIKVNEDNEALAGATFELYTKDENGNKEEYSNGFCNIEGRYIVTTDENGQLDLKGLEAGTYYLQEIEAPEGYSVNTHEYTIVIAATYATAEHATLDEGELAGYTVTVDDQEVGTGENPFKIPNTKLSSLPSTGGIGTTIFTVAGCGIMIAAAFFFFASRKKEN